MGVGSNLVYILTSPAFLVPTILVFIVIIVIWTLKDSFHTHMQTIVFTICDIQVSFWSISHILLYIYYGFMFPDYFIEFLIIGLGWEAFEFLMGKVKMSELIQGCEGATCKEHYWYGQAADPAMNCLGFLIGVLCAKIVF